MASRNPLHPTFGQFGVPYQPPGGPYQARYPLGGQARGSSGGGGFWSGAGDFAKNNWADILAAAATGWGIYQQGQDRKYDREQNEADRAMTKEEIEYRRGRDSRADAEYASRAGARKRFWDANPETIRNARDTRAVQQNALPPTMNLQQLLEQMRRG